MSVGVRRLLVVCPSWLGDAVMATPALRLLRTRLPGAFIGGLVRPGLDELLAGTGFFDEVHVDRAQGVMGPKRVAARVRPRMYDAALLLTNSFSTALIARLAFIPRRIGYDRDGRGLLLTDRLSAERRPGGGWACVPAARYYWRAACAVLGEREAGAESPVGPLELGVTEEQERAGRELLGRAGFSEGGRLAVVNPGANNPAKRWPAERFGAVAASLVREHGMSVLVNGSPAEREVAAAVVGAAGSELEERDRGRVVAATDLGTTIGSLKAVVRAAARSGGVMVTNDTGPRHVAAAFGLATVTLYGPTDPRWTLLPVAREGEGRRVEVVAEPNLPEGSLADDHPELCRIEKIAVSRVLEAVRGVLPP